MVNTNGIVLAQDPAFARRLATYAPGIEVYLQFDSLRADVHKALRGADLTRIRTQALQNLNAAGVSTTLVVTLKKGLNDDEIGTIIDFALKEPCVRGVTLQPIQFAGRTQGVAPRGERLTLTEVRAKLLEQSAMFAPDDIIPVPCNPDALAMGYAIKTPAGALPLTRLVGRDVLLASERSTIVYENDAALRGEIFKLFSTNHSPEGQANCLSSLLCCLPDVQAPATLDYRQVFRVLIMAFMDAVAFDVRAMKRSCVHIVQPDGRIIPFESFNLLYRDNGEVLAQRRTEVDASFGRRVVPIHPASGDFA
jgi:uncharacterized radical SAM superfamily Fe-S cluster-containing enzyme